MMKAKLLLPLIAACTMAATSALTDTSPSTSSYLVQAENLDTALNAIRAVDGTVTHRLGIIDAAAATLTEAQVKALRESDDVRLMADGSLTVAGTPQPDTFYPALVGADQLHDIGITGAGVTVAVIDTGVWEGGWLARDTSSSWRILVHYDATTGIFDPYGSTDNNGHGTHVSSVILSSGSTKQNRKYNGLAPNARLVAVKAFDDNGAGSYADVIRGIDWVVANRDVHNIRIINMSFSAPARSHYWDDPLNQAVMRAWEAGIVVVASAGNVGPDPMTIGVPGNVPYVITVGAMTDSGTPTDGSDDILASFSAAGPTVEGFVKPEVVAPGGHVRGIMESEDLIAQQHPEYYQGNNTFEMSGTSQSAAVVSGVIALLLEAEPYLTPDQVKCKVMSSARPAVAADGSLAYSLFQQGAGLVNAYAAVFGTTYDCANRGLDVSAEFLGTHFGGRANQDANGDYYLMGLEGYLWRDGYLWSNGYLWTNAYLWRDGYLWADAYLWSNGYNFTDSSGNSTVNSTGYLWSNAYLWSNGYLWSNSLTETMSINAWVEEQTAPESTSSEPSEPSSPSTTEETTTKGGGKGRK